MNARWAQSRIFPAYPRVFAAAVFQFLLDFPSVSPVDACIILTFKLNAMKKFVKNYVGKGKSTPLGIIKVHLLVSELMKHVHQFNDQDYVNIEIARLKAPDNFGRDYTAYVNNLVEVADRQEPAAATETPVDPLPAEVTEPVKKTRKGGKKAAPVAEDAFPF